MFFEHGACWVLCIYRAKSNSTNDMESPPMALEPPRVVRRVALKAGRTAWRFPQEKTWQLHAAVPRIVISLNIHIFNQLKGLTQNTHTPAASEGCAGKKIITFGIRYFNWTIYGSYKLQFCQISFDIMNKNVSLVSSFDQNLKKCYFKYQFSY